jgi:hypothetical protein
MLWGIFIGIYNKNEKPIFIVIKVLNMPEKRPNVFPNIQEKTNTANPVNTTIVSTLNTQQPETQKVDNEYETKKFQVAQEVYSNSLGETGYNAIEEMRERTEKQIRLREEALKRNEQQTQAYQEKFATAQQRPVNVQPESKVVSTPTQKSQMNIINTPMKNIDPYIQEISQPQFNASYDLIPLPSNGKLYRNKKANVKVAYMTTADENILTSPNLLKSGEFLEILINRKLLETDIRYKDLHVGDRNAIMLWLRATSYGHMYPVTLFDENDDPFETEIDLNTLKTKNLGAEPDIEGYFDFFLPLSKAKIKFKLLTVGDIDEIESLVDADTDAGVLINNSGTYTLERQIIEVNGERNRQFIKEFVQNLRIKDAKELREYINEIESGINLEIEVGTPRGGSIKTFLPLNVRFFWPDISV